MNTHEAMLGVLGCFGLLALASASAPAQHDHEASPYGARSEQRGLEPDCR